MIKPEVSVPTFSIITDKDICSEKFTDSSLSLESEKSSKSMYEPSGAITLISVSYGILLYEVITKSKEPGTLAGSFKFI